MAKAARKIDDFKVETREDADQALKQIGQSSTLISQAENEAEEKITDIRDDLVESTKTLREWRTQLEKALKKWAQTDRESWGVKMLDLTFGKIGFRFTPWAIKYLNKVDTVIGKIEAARMKQFLRITKSVDKERALLYNNSKLEPLGMKKIRREEFFCEPKHEEVKG